jgi:hypothetical protein
MDKPILVYFQEVSYRRKKLSMEFDNSFHVISDSMMSKIVFGAAHTIF